MKPALDKRFMRRAIEVAGANPKHPFGAVIVDTASGNIVAEGVNQSRSNPLWHGEIVAINHCVKQIADVNWSSLTLFTTAEPCPMCMSAILWCGFESVRFGTSIPTLVDLGWNQINIRATEVVQQSHRPQTSIIGGVLESRCDDLFRIASQDSIPS